MAQVMKKEFDEIFNTVMVHVPGSESNEYIDYTPIVLKGGKTYISLEDWFRLHSIDARCEFADNKPAIFVHLKQMWYSTNHEEIAKDFPDYRLRAELKWDPDTGCAEDTELVLELPF